MTIEEIEQLGEQCARKYNPGSIAPFPYENVIAAHPDLDIYFADLEDDDVSGVTLRESDKHTILVNSTKPDTRQNFTLGHELGHYFLHKNILEQQRSIIDNDALLDAPGMLFRADSEAKTQVEVDANHFAAALIMPADLVRRAWEATRSIEDCAAIFKVSAIAMTIRLTRLGLVEG